MAISTIPSGGTNNAFLDSLPAASARALLSRLTETRARSGAYVATAGRAIESVVFPTGAVVSAVTEMRDGTAVEVTLVGREAFFGSHLALGDGSSPHEAMVQIPGTLLSMDAVAFSRRLREDPALLRKALSYVRLTIATIGQLSACNRLHPTNERCARWLLMAHDRVLGDEFSLTHEFLATMLGVRRPGVTIAAGQLHEAGLISYRRGTIAVRDRAGLETVACECYAIVSDETKRIMGYDVDKRTNATSALGERPD